MVHFNNKPSIILLYIIKELIFGENTNNIKSEKYNINKKIKIKEIAKYNNLNFNSFI